MLIRDVRVQFEDAASFLAEYERSLSGGWIFVASQVDFEVGEALEITLDLDFCSRSVRVLGVVTSRITTSLGAMLGRPAGAVVEFADGISALDEMLQDTIDALHGSTQPTAPKPARQASASSTRTLTHRIQGHGTGTGAVLELDGIDLDVGESVSLHMVDPRTGDLIALCGRVVGPGSDLKPLAGRFGGTEGLGQSSEPMLQRVRDLSAARRQAGISGNLSGLNLPALLQSIATSSQRGTMDIVCEGLEAHLLFESNRLRYAGVGKTEGIKALARLLEWPEGEFSFQPTIDADEPDRPLVSIDSALMEAAHQADELRRLSSNLPPDTAVVERTETGESLQITPTQVAVLNHLQRPACSAAVLDALPYPDAEIWRALLDLVQRGFVRIRPA